MVRFGRDDKGTVVADPFLRPLFDDMVECEELMTKAPPETIQFARRTYFRAFFAYLEGQLFWLQGQARTWLRLREKLGHQLDVSKLALLDDNLYRVDKTGNMIPERNRLPFLNRCALVLRAGAECFGIDPTKLFGDDGWHALQEAVQVRNRLTHPKGADDLKMSEEEIERLRVAHTWFLNAVVQVANAGVTMARNLRGGPSDSPPSHQ